VVPGVPPLPPVPPKATVPPRNGEKIYCDGNCYYIGELINTGGFGAAYKCTDDWGNSLVAKMILPQNRAYERVRKEWLAEFSNLRHLRHPNITYIHQAFEYRDTFYIIVERCASDLMPLIRQSSVDGERWLPYIARDVLHGLDFIHRNGYVHKDIHPGNVFISHQYDPIIPSKEPVWSFKIGDFGISLRENDARMGRAMFAEWMAPPESLDSAEFGAVGRHADIYHVGLLFLDLLLHRVPEFNRDEILRGVPRMMAEKLQSPYAPTIVKALSRHVRYRQQSALEMWREISAAMPRL
jgi:serine/threonine-protein kinase